MSGFEPSAAVEKKLATNLANHSSSTLLPTVEKPDPKGVPTFCQCKKFYPRRGFELMST